MNSLESISIPRPIPHRPLPWSLPAAAASPHDATAILRAFSQPMEFLFLPLTIAESGCRDREVCADLRRAPRIGPNGIAVEQLHGCAPDIPMQIWSESLTALVRSLLGELRMLVNVRVSSSLRRTRATSEIIRSAIEYRWPSFGMRSCPR